MVTSQDRPLILPPTIDEKTSSSDGNNDNKETGSGTTAMTQNTPKKETRQELEARLTQLVGNVERLSTTESIGRRNVVHRRTQSTHLLTTLSIDSPENQNYRVRSMSVAQHLPNLLQFHPGSHLLDNFVAETGVLYLSLWLLPPQPLRTTLTNEIAKLALSNMKQGSSAPFIPHVTVIGSIKCDTQRQVKELVKDMKQGLAGMGSVPCRFHRHKVCEAMHTEDDEESKLVWSQACIARMEPCPEYMAVLQCARDVLHLPKGEWMFPPPARAPHYSKYYGNTALSTPLPPPPPNFDAMEAALFLTTPGTVAGVSQWRPVARFPLT
jgi:hypothetical protein